MKKVRLKFFNANKVYIKILDHDYLVYEGLICNEIELCLEEYKVYKIIAISNNTKLVTSFYVNDNYNYYFSFNRFIIFLLRDYYYNLPIERGELILWQKQ